MTQASKPNRGGAIALALALAFCGKMGCSGPQPTPPERPAAKPTPKQLKQLLPADVKHKVEALEEDIAANQQRTLDAMEDKPPTEPQLPSGPPSGLPSGK